MLVKPNEGYMTERPSISKLFHKSVTPPLLQTMSSPLVTTSNGTILKSSLWENSDLHCKIKERLLISDLKPALNENICSEKLFLYYFILEVSTTSIHLLLLLTYYQYLTSVFKFISFCYSCNCHFWRCML